MAPYSVDSHKLWLDGWLVSSQLSALALRYGAEVLDASKFGVDTRIEQGGLATIALEYRGFWKGGDNEVDDVHFDNLGLAHRVLTVGAVDGAEGDPGYMFRADIGEYSPEGAVGELLRFSVSARATQGPLVRGTLVHTGVETSSGNGTGYQLGAVGAGELAYSALHVVAASGTLDVTIQSDDSGAFGTPTTRITHSQFTAIGSEVLTVAGAITDDFWRAVFTVSGSFDFVVLLGIR